MIPAMRPVRENLIMRVSSCLFRAASKRKRQDAPRSLEGLQSPVGRTLLSSLALSLTLLAGPSLLAQNPPTASSPGEKSVGAVGVSSEDIEFFEKRVRPVLAEQCFACHSAKSKPPMSGLRLDSRAGLLKGGARGPSVRVGRPGESLFVKAISYVDPKLQMPPKGRLTDAQITALTEWVQRGAPWPPETRSEAGEGREAGFDLRARRAQHWAWQPIRRPVLPAVRRKEWPKTPIDYFVLAKLEAKGLSPAPPADRRALIRRVTYDLTGLPPTPKEIRDFLADRSPNAYEKVVDRLLASPHYGERWARHWLDLVRYAETDGHEFDFDKPGAYQYRDYVIRAFNADVPYNQFVMEHVAGDLLPAPRRHPTEKFNESIIGTGFFWLGEGKHSPVDLLEEQASIIDNQIDVLGKAFLGMGLGCARCHDHKFDAISTKDYYALFGYLKSSRYQLAAIDDPERLKPTLRELERLTEQIESLAGVGRDASGIRTTSLTLNTQPPTPEHLSTEHRAPPPFEDFSKPTYEGWHVTGEAFGTGPRRFSLAVKQTGDGLRVERFDGMGLADSGYLSDRLQGVLRSRTFTIEQPKVLYRMAGSGTMVSLIIDGFQRIQYPIYGGLRITLNSADRLAWHAMDVRKWIGHRAYVEIVDHGPGRIVVDQILFADQAPPDAAPTPSSIRSTQDASRIPELLAQRQRLEAQIPAPTRVLAMADGTGENARVHIRGSHKSLGEEIPRRFLEACGGGKGHASTAGSGRLELARAMVAPSNPLLPRVLVNRLWQHHFVEGIVRTPDDFGVMDQRPTHPELLDWLAAVFTEHGDRDAHARYACGWRLKKLHRLMVLSATYQMGSGGGAARRAATAESIDPQNRLLHRMPVRRLEAECIRDAILAVSGRLDRRLYGPSVPPYLTPFMEGRGRPAKSGPLDGAGRRSLYINVRRNFLTPLFLAFDYPVPFSTMGKRTVSNVPAQALTLMNNPFVVEQATHWARRLLEIANREARVETMYEEAFGRLPTKAEREAARDFIAEQDRRYGGTDDLRSWSDLCHVLFNSKEFIFIR